MIKLRIEIQSLKEVIIAWRKRLLGGRVLKCEAVSEWEREHYKYRQECTLPMIGKKENQNTRRKRERERGSIHPPYLRGGEPSIPRCPRNNSFILIPISLSLIGSSNPLSSSSFSPFPISCAISSITLLLLLSNSLFWIKRRRRRWAWFHETYGRFAEAFAVSALRCESDPDIRLSVTRNFSLIFSLAHRSHFYFNWICDFWLIEYKLITDELLMFFSSCNWQLQDEEPNERMISKLCEYASKNPLRVPKACIHFPLTLPTSHWSQLSWVRSLQASSQIRVLWMKKTWLGGKTPLKVVS